ncbi:hypothetical protein G9A89_005302 [Geosiphon pyriformis]|nr:hypothetical protein G9A89_005302 [Geosiphon pyriformis]
MIKFVFAINQEEKCARDSPSIIWCAKTTANFVDHLIDLQLSGVPQGIFDLLVCRKGFVVNIPLQSIRRPRPTFADHPIDFNHLACRKGFVRNIPLLSLRRPRPTFADHPIDLRSSGVPQGGFVVNIPLQSIRRPRPTFADHPIDFNHLACRKGFVRNIPLLSLRRPRPTFADHPIDLRSSGKHSSSIDKKTTVNFR